MGWIYAVLLAASVVVLVAAEWPRVTARAGVAPRLPRRRQQPRARHLRLVRTESEEFAASVERDLEQLPTIDERDR